MRMINEKSRQIILDRKIARIIELYSMLYDVSLEEATDIYYNSVTSQLIEEGVADLHCRSDKYLAALIQDEYMDIASKRFVK